MRKSRLHLGRVSLGVLAAGALTAAFGVPGVALASDSGPYGQNFTVTMSSASTPAGASTQVVFTITNDSSSSPLNSVTIALPGVLAISGVTVANGAPAVISGSTLTVGNPGAEITNTGPGVLGLSPRGGSTKVTLTAAAPCSAAADSLTWGFTGTNDNDNDSDDFSSPASISGSVTGTCHLAFATGGQPTDTVATDSITSAKGSLGGPVQVDVLNGANAVITSSAAPVTVSIESNPAGGVLSPPPPATTVDATNGIASFSGLSINLVGNGYTLGASSAGFTSAQSAAFDIITTYVPCTSSSCTGTVTNNSTTTSSASTTSATAGDFLELTLGGPSYTCAGYTVTSSPVGFDLFTSNDAPLPGVPFTGVLQIAKASVLGSGHPGASSWQICYASTAEFTAQLTTTTTGPAPQESIGGIPYFVGLLPLCTNVGNVAPCVVSQHKDGAGNEVVTFVATTDGGDPKWQA